MSLSIEWRHAFRISLFFCHISVFMYLPSPLNHWCISIGLKQITFFYHFQLFIYEWVFFICSSFREEQLCIKGVLLVWLVLGFFVLFLPLLDIFFIYISNVIPFPDCLLENTSSYPLLHRPAQQPTYSCFMVLAFPYTGAKSLQRTMALFSHWCPTRPSSATYAVAAISPTMCTPLLMV